MHGSHFHSEEYQISASRLDPRPVHSIRRLKFKSSPSTPLSSLTSQRQAFQRSLRRFIICLMTILMISGLGIVRIYGRDLFIKSSKWIIFSKRDDLNLKMFSSKNKNANEKIKTKTKSPSIKLTKKPVGTILISCSFPDEFSKNKTLIISNLLKSDNLSQFYAFNFTNSLNTNYNIYNATKNENATTMIQTSAANFTLLNLNSSQLVNTTLSSLSSYHSNTRMLNNNSHKIHLISDASSSFEMIYFSLCKYYEQIGDYPSKISLIGSTNSDLRLLKTLKIPTEEVFNTAKNSNLSNQNDHDHDIFDCLNTNRSEIRADYSNKCKNSLKLTVILRACSSKYYMKKAVLLLRESQK